MNKFLNTKKNNIRKLRKIIKNRDRLNDKLLLRLAFLKWNEGKDKYFDVEEVEIYNILFE